MQFSIMMRQLIGPAPIPIDNFEQQVLEKSADSDLIFAEEYKLIQELSPRHPSVHSEHPNNRLKNRFVNILPFDHSRVKLLPADDDECSDYVNANYMPGYNSKREFIASQGPMKSTVDDFWRMIWEQNVPLIVMVTQLEERGRERCAKYWPNDGEPMYFGDLQVSMRSESTLDSYVIRILDVRLGEQHRTVTQYHYIIWPDFGVPKDPENILDFIITVRNKVKPNQPGPLLVHCSAGVGRTGSFIAIDRLLQHIREKPTIDVFSVVLEMRNYRSYMIQVEAQYVLIHKCILAAIKRGLHRSTQSMMEDEPLYANNGAYVNNVEDNIYENTPRRY